MSAALAIEGVAVQRGGRLIVEEAALSLSPGECVVLAGESGSGKTSLLRVIGGLNRPARGTIRIAGVVVDDAAATFIRPELRGLGMVFQDFALWPHLSVLENVAVVIRDRVGRERKALALLDQFGVASCAGRLPATLSGGQQQRVGLARALAAAPRLLMLDEPFSSLDVETRETLRTELRALIVETGLGAICISHDPADIARLADRVALLEDRRLTSCTTPDAMFARPATPYAARLAGLCGGVEVEVRQAGSDAAIVLGSALLAIPGGGARLAGAAQALLFWPRGALALAAEGVPATCIGAHFEAGHWQALLRLDGLAAPVPVQCTSPPPRGAVALNVASDRLHLFPSSPPG
ncbi:MULTISPECIES: ABC transporter ATP-binding protein [unclassified Acidiphilium]|uniref:ABC transporter ATP-binding protein n=1 Tax=unclassified Acidiphilium TaxID=2617493 RepID=UPI000BD31FF4|nr:MULTISPECIES: ATP-binding cassette domain-containing protein [unclassified Acidiphilium]OYV55203.1 MAG: ABC transporter [Acidiphilium sp. 20-67-58]HQT61522.1 ATP-binding cassette domain-containing protein [Acidiphilium sp.]